MKVSEKKCRYCGALLKPEFSKCEYCQNPTQDVEILMKEFEENIKNARSTQAKNDLIKEFSIPNNEEVVLSFMILASSNFDARYYVNHMNEDDISDAWLIKIKQCYEKALTFKKDSYFYKIENMYQETMQKIAVEKKKKTFEIIASILLICGGFLLVLVPITAIGVIGLTLAICGIVLIVPRKEKRSPAQTTAASKREKGFSTWNTWAKVGWVILNIYTIGIPAIVYYSKKSN